MSDNEILWIWLTLLWPSKGVTLGPNPNLGEIIEALKEKSDDLKVKLLLGIALQEAGSDPEALKVFTECAEMGSVSGSAISHMMRPYLKC